MKKLLLLSAMLIFACSSDDSSDNNSQFEGEWSGTFDGGDSGTWTATVDSDGSLVGNVYSSVFEESYSATGAFFLNGNVV